MGASKKTFLHDRAELSHREQREAQKKNRASREQARNHFNNILHQFANAMEVGTNPTNNENENI